MAWFWWSFVNKDVEQFIRAYENCQLVDSCSHESQQLLQTIESNTQFDMVFLDFWEPGVIPDWDKSRKILTCLGCMTGFGLVTAIGMK